jgi:heparan-alpha-glucosaminide N-acetyltransferase
MRPPRMGTAPRAPRLVSLDAYRGCIMLLLAAGGFGFAQVARNQPGSAFWAFLGYEFDHVAWRGCGVWDLIQPSFMFMVGVAIPFSYASRHAKGESDRVILAHVVRRAVILILLGVFLSSRRATRLEWVFVNVLSQIGLGYLFVFLLRSRGLRAQLTAMTGLLFADWLLFALAPIVPGSRPFEGFAAHWNLGANVAHDFDLWFLNLFPRQTPFTGNSGGYQTLNFLPAMGTMLLGLIAGETLRSDRSPTQKLRHLIRAALICFALGVACDPAILPGVPSLWVVCPIVKRLWTPSWTLFSAGWTFALLAAFYWVVDLRGHQRWTFPLVVVGMNSIAIYLVEQLMRDWLQKMLGVVLGPALFAGPYGPIPSFTGAAALMWLMCWWMYRRKLFLRI